MSQLAVEQILGRLLTDAEFRDCFFAGSYGRVFGLYPLSSAEQRSLLASRPALKKELIESLGKGLEESICRADLRLVVENAANQRPIEDSQHDNRYSQQRHELQSHRP